MKITVACRFTPNCQDWMSGRPKFLGLLDAIIKNLERLGVECKKVVVYRGRMGNFILRFPVLGARKKRGFEEILDESKPDAVILDNPNDLWMVAAGRKIPVLAYFWDQWIHGKISREDGGFLTSCVWRYGHAFGIPA